MDPDTFPKWKSYFKNEGFKVMRVPFVVLYNRENIQRRVLRDFPQSHIEFGLVAKSSGVHPDGFKPKFEDGSVPIEARYASAIDAMPCIEKLKLPNSISPLYIHEKSKELIIHLPDILSPPQCHVLEPSAKTMATSLACLDRKRGCNNIEKDNVLYKYALGRLRVFTSPGAQMADLDDFVDIQMKHTFKYLLKNPLLI